MRVNNGVESWEVSTTEDHYEFNDGIGEKRINVMFGAAVVIASGLVGFVLYILVRMVLICLGILS